ncbi:MAG: GNAT family N-acetyltransferase [Acidimicrobiales bacterium]
MICLATPRLLLRTWRAEDRADLDHLLSGAASSVGNLVDGIDNEITDPVGTLQRAWDDDGFGVFALESLDDGGFVGLAGLLPAEANHGRSLDMVWRLGNGGATAAETPTDDLAAEALMAVIDWAFGLLDVDLLAASVSADDAASTATARAAGLSNGARTLEASTGTWVDRFSITLEAWREPGERTTAQREPGEVRS